MRQAERLLSNYFARFWYVKAERGLRKWKDVCANQRFRDSYLHKLSLHSRKNQFTFFKSTILNHIHIDTRTDLSR